MLGPTDRQEERVKGRSKNGPHCGHPEACSASPLLPKGEREKDVGKVLASGPLELVALLKLSFQRMHPVHLGTRFPALMPASRGRGGDGHGSFVQEGRARGRKATI